MFKVKHYFDDPHLKNAMKRVLCAHEAPEKLRQRVGKIVCPAHALMQGRAVALLITAGVVVLASMATWVGKASSNPQEAILNANTADNLIKTHDMCCSAPDHHFLPGVGRNDIAMAGTTLAQQLGIPVIAAALPGWSFAGAGACPVWAHRSAHFLYRNGDQALSIFALPAGDFVESGTGNFDVTTNDHQISGFVRDGALYCVVVKSSQGGVNDKNQAGELRDRLKDDFSPAMVLDVAPKPGDGELMYAVGTRSGAGSVRGSIHFIPPQLSLFQTHLIAYHSMP